LLLGHPTVAFAVVVTSLLCALGAGSMLSGRLAPEESASRTLAVAALSLLVVIGSSLMLTAGANALRALGPTTRAAIIALVLFTVAIPLGTLLPSAIRIAKTTGAATAAGCWSTNASCSVLGTLTAALLVRSHGFDVTNHCTWLAYSAALGLWLSLSSTVRRERLTVTSRETKSWLAS
jgi:predicted membrane-bound spermidine synthase